MVNSGGVMVDRPKMRRTIGVEGIRARDHSQDSRGSFISTRRSDGGIAHAEQQGNRSRLRMTSQEQAPRITAAAADALNAVAQREDNDPTAMTRCGQEH